MNKNRTEFSLPFNHIKITPYWLLGLIEGEGSFHLRRNTLTPTFSFSLTQAQTPLMKEIVYYLIEQLDEYSAIKANNTKLFNFNLEKARGNAKPILKLSLFQLDYLFNIFIPFLNNLKFKSKKKLDFNDFKLITTLIYQGKHLIPEVKEFIIQLSYSMNNFRLSTYNITKNEITSTKFIFTPFCENDKLKKEKIFLTMPELFILNNEKQIINIKTGKLIRDTYVIEVITQIDNTISRAIYPTILDCAKKLNITRTIIYNILKN
jgi:hypothetical protein